jgi:hypothetical protein
MDVEAIWSDLAAERPSVAGIVRQRVLPRTGRDIFLAVVHPSLRPMLVLRVRPDALGSLGELPQTRAVRTTVVEIDDLATEIRVELEAPEAVKVFAPFVLDVASCVGESSDDAGAVRALLERFGHWRRLLSGEAAEGLGAEAAQGLWGELWSMRHLLHPAWGDDVVAAWTGPDRDDNDFRHHAVAIEVKTMRGDRPETVRINGERQLDHAQGVVLVLVALAVDVHRQGGGESLPAMVGACRSLVAGAPAADLEDRLLAWGYSEAHRARYEDTRYTLRGMAAFRVDEGFPRIIESDLRQGVGSVRYRVSLDACRAWQLDTDTQLAKILSEEA